MEELKIGYDLVIDEIPEGSRVLDLGCGDGTLLKLLQEQKNVSGFGVEISEEGVSQCVEKGVYCYQADIDEGLSDYRDNSFDYVILNQTIQNTKRPDYVIKEVLRIGKKSIVSFPNFGYYRTRAYLMFKGTMPVSKLLPYQWYDSPNIHLLTIKDMIRMAEDFSFSIISEKHFSLSGVDRSNVISIAPNLLAEYGFFVITSIES
jgi:methionine biosynthesis protein MetW